MDAMREALVQARARVVEALRDAGDATYHTEDLRAVIMQCDVALAAHLDGLREAVRWFAQQMEARLRECDHKGGWGQCAWGFLWHSANTNLHEIVGAMAEPPDWAAVIRAAADVANYAMMIADTARREQPHE